jgi:hypothetical protein
MQGVMSSPESARVTTFVKVSPRDAFGNSPIAE